MGGLHGCGEPSESSSAVHDSCRQDCVNGDCTCKPYGCKYGCPGYIGPAPSPPPPSPPHQAHLRLLQILAIATRKRIRGAPKSLTRTVAAMPIATLRSLAVGAEVVACHQSTRSA